MRNHKMRTGLFSSMSVWISVWGNNSLHSGFICIESPDSEIDTVTFSVTLGYINTIVGSCETTQIEVLRIDVRQPSSLVKTLTTKVILI